MKYCAECGTQLNDDERFCSNCGMPVSDDTETGIDGAEAPKSTEETAQPVPANESQEQPNTAEASAPEQSNEPGNGNKPPADKKSGYIGCIVLIFLVVVLFKGCGMLFGDKPQQNNNRFGSNGVAPQSSSNAPKPASNVPEILRYVSLKEPHPSKGKKNGIAFLTRWRCDFCGKRITMFAYDEYPTPFHDSLRGIAPYQQEVCPKLKALNPQEPKPFHVYSDYFTKQWYWAAHDERWPDINGNLRGPNEWVLVREK